MGLSIECDQMLTERDRHQITSRGMSLKEIERQIEIFQQGIPFVKLKKACHPGDGITQLNPSEITQLSRVFEVALSAGRVMKFVPASGAASRMFKSLLTVLGSSSNQTHRALPSESATTTPEQEAVRRFLTGLQHFAFYEDLRSVMAQKGLDIEQLRAEGQFVPILEYLLHSPGLNYAKLPKGLLKFHHSPSHPRTPIEEHLVEAAAYAKDAHQQARVHFTVSPEHHEAVTGHVEGIRPLYEKAGVKYLIGLSTQKASGDTIAVDLNNQPFRDQQGNLLFRPGGHGALLENLNDLQGDVIFIKNIDNVVPDRLKEETYTYKRAMGGLLVELQECVFHYLNQLASGSLNEEQLQAIADFCKQKLSTVFHKKYSGWTRQERANFLFAQLHRPIRVCGMVKNTGDTGGGPFWVEHPDTSLSLQIVETSQVDPSDAEQQAILRSSTHFHSVDMVCGIRDYSGKPFDLRQFTDPDTGFIAKKSYEGRELKALELPGLWNGSMAKWNTMFVEIPRSTFNPVKTVLDLLQPAHQPR